MRAGRLLRSSAAALALAVTVAEPAGGESPPLRMEEAPARPQSAAQTYRISDQDLASRLSFFLWGTGPDPELMKAADAAVLRTPAGLARQVRRTGSTSGVTSSLLEASMSQILERGLFAPLARFRADAAVGGTARCTLSWNAHAFS